MAANWIAPGRAFHATHADNVVHGAPVQPSRPVVLIVDDNADLRDLVSVKLYQSGYDVKTATNGWDALRAAADTNPDLVVLDIMMPGPSGLEVCRKLRADPHTAQLPVLMLSAAFTASITAEAMAAGANRCMDKPFRLRELVIEIEALLSRG